MMSFFMSVVLTVTGVITRNEMLLIAAGLFTIASEIWAHGYKKKRGDE